MGNGPIVKSFGTIDLFTLIHSSILNFFNFQISEITNKLCDLSQYFSSCDRREARGERRKAILKIEITSKFHMLKQRPEQKHPIMFRPKMVPIHLDKYLEI